MTRPMQRLGIVPYSRQKRELQLPEWDFQEGEEAKLCAWGNIVKDERRGNLVNTRFSNGNTVKNYLLPFRYIQQMPLGTTVVNGYPRLTPPSDEIMRLCFSPAEADILLLKDCPDWIKAHWHYQSDSKDSFGEQPIFRFRQDDQLYLMAAMEFVRKCYIANALHCDDVMYPGRMETAVSYYRREGTLLTLHLMSRYKSAHITQGTATFLARWYGNIAFQANFNSIATETILMAGRKSSRPLRLDKPSFTDLHISCTAIRRQKHSWITRITDLRGIPVHERKVLIYQGNKKSRFSVIT